ncbi:hypothetical protein SAMN05518849_101567 [Sphingobium sp. AP50]|nr:hypothetical protein SAMN05518849_101567 [Sphingobium sp. AP50]
MTGEKIHISSGASGVAIASESAGIWLGLDTEDELLDLIGRLADAGQQRLHSKRLAQIAMLARAVNWPTAEMETAGQAFLDMRADIMDPAYPPLADLFQAMMSAAPTRPTPP